MIQRTLKLKRGIKHVNLVIENTSDLFKRNVMVLHFMVLDKSIEQPEDAIRKAVREYLKTPEGKRAAEYSSGDYNWGDVASTIPDSFWKEHGLLPMNTASVDVWVNHDEVLCEEYGPDVFEA